MGAATVARKKTVLGGVTIGPDIELLLIIAAVGVAGYYLWTNYGSGLATSIGTDVSNAASDVTSAFSSGGDTGTG